MNQLDNQLGSLNLQVPPPAFPAELTRSLRRRRIVRRARIAAVIAIPLLVASVILSWPRPSSVNVAPRIVNSVLRADPARLPEPAAWQPSQVDRALDGSNFDLSGF